MATSALLQQLQTAATAAMPPGTTWKTGNEKVAYQGAPPRVVFSYGPDDDFGPASPRGVGNAMSPPRAFATRIARMRAHLWGRTHDEAESMLTALVAALFSMAIGSMSLIGGHWEDTQNATAGAVYVLTWSFEIPLTAPAPATAPITSLPQDVQKGP